VEVKEDTVKNSQSEFCVIPVYMILVIWSEFECGRLMIDSDGFMSRLPVYIILALDFDSDHELHDFACLMD
jgi:hypothetical protein